MSRTHPKHGQSQPELEPRPRLRLQEPWRKGSWRNLLVELEDDEAEEDDAEWIAASAAELDIGSKSAGVG